MSVVFEEVRFPVDISWGAVGGPTWNTTISQSAGGFEQRNINWANARHKWDVRYGVKRREQMLVLLAFFNSMRGRATGFRFLPPLDNRLEVERFGTGDGILTTFQLTKTYTIGTRIWVRNITKPSTDLPMSLGPFQIFKAGVLDPTAVVNTTTGIVTFSPAPGVAVALTATGPFDCPVRFDMDDIGITEELEDIFDLPAIMVVETREIA